MPEARIVAKAIGLYLPLAYPREVPPRIATLIAGIAESSGDACAHRSFVRQEDGENAAYALRLGCAHYPHVKMLVVIWPGQPGYFFRVDGHDRHILVPQNHPEHAAFEQLRRKNQALAEAIESAWGDAGLPTYTFCFNQEVTQLAQGIERHAR